MTNGGVSSISHTPENASCPGLPQLKEISFKKTITVVGGVNINCIYYTIFSKVLCLTCFQLPTHYKGSPMQISCGSPDRARQIVACKRTLIRTGALVVFVLKNSEG